FLPGTHDAADQIAQITRSQEAARQRLDKVHRPQTVTVEHFELPVETEIPGRRRAIYIDGDPPAQYRISGVQAGTRRPSWHIWPDLGIHGEINVEHARRCHDTRGLVGQGVLLSSRFMVRSLSARDSTRSD